MKPATAGGPYRVPRQNGGWRAITLAVAMHAVLLLFLWVGVSWQNNEPTEVQAEIWDMKVQDAAPAPPPTPAPEPDPEPEPQPVVKAPPPPAVEEAPPAPKEPDIALERLKAKKKQLEEEKLQAAKEAKQKKEADEKLAKLKKEEDDRQAKLEAKKAAEKQAEKDAADEKAKEEKLAAEKEKKKAAAEKLAKEKAAKADKAAQEKAFAAEMSRITGAAAKGSTGTADQSTGSKVDGGYAAAIRAKIRSNIVYGSADDSLTATFQITQLPSGEIIGKRKLKSSGSDAYDSALENAITKSSPLPKKKDGTVERELTLEFKLKDMH